MNGWDSFYIRQALESGTAGCGDAGMILNREKEIFCSLIDAVGHGTKAAIQADSAKTYIEERSSEELDEIMKGLHTHLGGTPGAVAALVRLDKNNGHFSYCSIGNIGLKILGSEKTKTLKAQEGIIGYSIPTPRILSSCLQRQETLILYSDGLRDNELRSDYCRDCIAQDAKSTAINLLRAFGKNDDDRSCLILKSIDG